MAITLPVKTRTIRGKKVNQLRLIGELPMVVYGHGKVARSLEASLKQFRRVVDEAGRTSLIDLVIDEAVPIKVLVHDIQHDPVSGVPLHADLYQVDMKQKITAEIPLRVDGEAPAVINLDGTLLISQDYVEVEALPQDLPKEIVVDITSLATFDDAITAGKLQLPVGVTLVTDADMDLVFVQPPREEEVEETTTAAETEKAVIEGMAAEDAAKLAEKEAEGGEQKDE